MKAIRKFDISHYATMFCGAAILSFGLFNIHSQSNITEGGVLGMILLLEHWLHISPALSALASYKSQHIGRYIGFNLLFYRLAFIGQQIFEKRRVYHPVLLFLLSSMGKHRAHTALLCGYADCRVGGGRFVRGCRRGHGCAPRRCIRRR